MSLPEPFDAPDIPAPSVLREAVDMELDALDTPEQTSEGSWKVTDRTQADWVGRLRQRRLDELAAVRHRAERQIAAVMAAIKPHLDPIEQWQAQRTATLQREIEHLETLLTNYHRHEVESADADPPLTIKLPHVELCSRKAPDKWEFAESFVEWARENRPDLLREEVTKPKAKKEIAFGPESGAVVVEEQADDDGQIVKVSHIPVPGVTVERGERGYWIGGSK